MAPPQRFLEIEEYAEGFTIVWMNRNPVNTMDTEMWMQLSKALRDVESNPKQRGIAFLSGVTKNVFTAGNDILELYAPRTTRDKYKRFWKISNTFLGNLYVSRLVTIAGIRGACPAGGCCLSLCCDYRIMTDNGYIGLNEVALGISVPKYWGKLMERTVGSGKAEKLLQFARLLKTKDAHECGLVDTVCSADQLKTRVVETLKQLTSSKLPEMGRAVRFLS